MWLIAFSYRSTGHLHRDGELVSLETCKRRKLKIKSPFSRESSVLSHSKEQVWHFVDSWFCCSSFPFHRWGLDTRTDSFTSSLLFWGFFSDQATTWEKVTTAQTPEPCLSLLRSYYIVHYLVFCCIPWMVHFIVTHNARYTLLSPWSVSLHSNDRNVLLI